MVMEMEPELKKVVKRGNQWCIIHCTGPDAGKIIKGSCHADKGKTDAMHRAIQAGKHGASKKDMGVFYTDDINFEEVEVKGEKELFVTGHISNTQLDLVNDIVTDFCLKDMMEQMKERAIKLDVEHESFIGATNLEREINKTIIPAGKIVDFTRDDGGLWVKGQINKHSSRFKETKGSIKDGYLDAFSIAYFPIEAVKKNGVRYLNKIRLLNIALTGNAANTGAKISEVFMKTLERINEEEKCTGCDAMEAKSYEKDGGHAHTNDEPLGNHSHPEIESAIRRTNDRLDDVQYGDKETGIKAKDKRPPKAWFDKCVSAVRKRGGAKDPEAVCGWLFYHKKEGKSIFSIDLKEFEEGDERMGEDEGKNIEEIKSDLETKNKEIEGLKKELKDTQEKLKEFKDTGDKLKELEEVKAKLVKLEKKDDNDGEDGDDEDGEPDEKEKEIKALKEKVDKMQSELKEFMAMPQYKATTEAMKAELNKGNAEAEAKKGPLDAVA